MILGSLSNLSLHRLNNCVQFARGLVSQCCLLCHAQSGRRILCKTCDYKLPRLAGPICRQCATPLPAGQRCGACFASPPRFDHVVAPFAYVLPIDALIQALKYGGRLLVSRPLADALASTIDERVDLLIPMPLSEARLRERGFNQAHEIARLVSRATETDLALNVCRRVRHNPPQAMLPWKQRAGSVRGAFVCDADLHGMRVAVVDDVVTTGATLNEIARVLKRAGASHVSGWSAARVLRHAVTPGPAN